MVKPIDRLIREQLAPALKRESFVRRGRNFWYEEQGKGKVIVHLRSYPLQRPQEISLHADIYLQPRVWAAWLIDRQGEAGMSGMVTRRLVPPRAADDASDVWLFDLDDESLCEQLVAAVVLQATRYKQLLAPEKLLAAYLDGTIPAKRERPLANGAFAVGLLLSESGPSQALNEILEQVDASDITGGAAVAFIRRNAAERAALGGH